MVISPEIRTNNHLEGYHSKMNKALKPHSSISKVIDFFKAQDQISSHEYLAHKAGKTEPKTYTNKKKSYIDFENKLNEIQNDYENLCFNEYFYKVSHHITYGRNKSEELNDLNDDNEIENEQNNEPHLNEKHHKYTFTSSFKYINFLKRIDFESKTINRNNNEIEINNSNNKIIAVKKEPDFYVENRTQDPDICIEKECVNHAYRFNSQYTPILSIRELFFRPGSTVQLNNSPIKTQAMKYQVIGIYTIV